MSYHSDLALAMMEARPMHFDDCRCDECRHERNQSVKFPWQRKLGKNDWHVAVWNDRTCDGCGKVYNGPFWYKDVYGPKYCLDCRQELDDG